MSSVSRAIRCCFALGSDEIVRMLWRRSASLMSRTRMSFAMATSILRSDAACCASLESNWSRSSFVTPSTMAATSGPNWSCRSSAVTVVSSTASWRSAAAIVMCARPSPPRIMATPSGCAMYGSPDRRPWSAWATRATSNARSIRAVSAFRCRSRYATTRGATSTSTWCRRQGKTERRSGRASTRGSVLLMQPGYRRSPSSPLLPALSAPWLPGAGGARSCRRAVRGPGRARTLGRSLRRCRGGHAGRRRLGLELLGRLRLARCHLARGLVPRELGRGALPKRPVARLTLLPPREQRRRHEDRRVGTRQEADEQREREIPQCQRAEQPGPDEEQRRHGEHSHERGAQRPHEHLVHRPVHHLRVRVAAYRPDRRDVLLDLVEDDHGVVQREPEDRQEGDHSCRRHLEAGERIDADRDDDVVYDGDDRRDCHLPFEPDRQVQGDEAEEHDERLDRVVAHLIAKGRADGADAHVGPLRAAVLRRRVGDGVLFARSDVLRLHPNRRPRVAPEDQHLGVAEAERADQAADVAHGRGLALDGHLPRRAALEVDPEVEPAREDGGERDHDHGAREDRPPPRSSREVEVRALVVEVGRPVPPPVGQRAHAVASLASSPEPMPTTGTRTSALRRDRMTTSGCMKKYATKRSSSVERPRKNAKPLTEPDARK